MRANVLRDAQSMPELAALLEDSVVPYLVAVRDLLAEGWKVNDERRRRLLATLELVIDFHTSCGQSRVCGSSSSTCWEKRRYRERRPNDGN